MSDINEAAGSIAPPRQRTGPRGPAPARGANVPAVARAARLLDTLAAAKQAMTLAALVKALGLPKSTVHGLCATLAQANLVERLDNGSYQLGTRVMDLAHAYMARTDVVAEFQALLKTGSPMPEESLVLSVLDGADIVYVGCRNGSRPFGFNFRIGMRLPANCTASGKAMLSSLPAERVVDLAVSRAFYSLTRKSVTRPEPLLAQLRQVAAQGYAVDDEETRRGMVCIGAPIFGPASAEAVAAVAVSLPKSTLTADRKALAIRTVGRLAGAISHRLGARGAGTPGVAG
ncbi:MAG TPA: IclR family transcriptional regulator [Zeimonas sp.]|nr:IclR family transcriptional regulator [Zeimonas sp.]